MNLVDDVRRLNAVMLLSSTYGFFSLLGAAGANYVFGPSAGFSVSVSAVPYMYVGSLLALGLYIYRRKMEAEKFSKYDKFALLISILTLGVSALAIFITPGLGLTGYDTDTY
ncbi:MAG: hypothetical protein ABEK16_00300 [Candidatus Nanohalobium sp.]